MTEDKSFSDFEILVRKTAVDLTSGVFFERMTPMALWEKAEKPVGSLLGIAATLKEEATLLKPEKYHTIEKHYNTMVQKLNTFREILFQRTTEPATNSRLAIEQLRLALVEASDLLQMVREARTNPNPVIKAILDLKAGSPKTFQITSQGEERPQEKGTSKKENAEQQGVSTSKNSFEESDKKIAKSEEIQATLEMQLKKEPEGASR